MDVQDMGGETVCVHVRVNSLEVRGEGEDIVAWTLKRVGEEGEGRKMREKRMRMGRCEYGCHTGGSGW